MTAEIIDGKAIAADLRAEVGQAAARFAAAVGRKPGLAVVLVGEDPASSVYVRNKGRAAEAAGIEAATHRLSAETAEGELLALIARLNADDHVDGILVQLPLPPAIDAARVIEAIDPAKDVDGFHPVNIGRLAGGLPALVPCTPRGCLKLIEHVLPAGMRGKGALVVGRSNIVGRPVAELLLRADCTVTIAHSRSADLPALVAAAEILVAAVGRPGMIEGAWIRPGAVVIDVGINRVLKPGEPEGGATRLVGDIDTEAAMTRAGAITPVPGGVGPMTIACLMENTLTAASRRAGQP